MSSPIWFTVLCWYSYESGARIWVRGHWEMRTGEKKGTAETHIAMNGLNPGTTDETWHELLTHHVATDHSLPWSKLSNGTCVGLIFHRNVQLANPTLLNYTAEINTIVATLAWEMALEETKPQACLWRLLSLTTIFSLVNTFYSYSTAAWTNHTFPSVELWFSVSQALGNSVRTWSMKGKTE